MPYDINDPSTMVTKDNVVSIIHNICARNNAKLEFEMKLKNENNQSIKTVIPVDGVLSDSEEDGDESFKRKNKYVN